MAEEWRAIKGFGGWYEVKRYVVAHWDGDYKNNTTTNLRWATYEDNFRDFMRHLEEKCCSHCPRRK